MRTVVLQLDKAALLPLTVVDGVLRPSKGHVTACDIVVMAMPPAPQSHNPCRVFCGRGSWQVPGSGSRWASPG